MSNDVAIKVEGLSKEYRIGEKELYRTLRDAVTTSVSGPFRRLRNTLRHTNSPRTESRSDKFWALKDISFEVKRGEVIGVIGHNGAGKSTLLKILSRITEPTSGYADVYGRIGSLLEVGTGFHAELTGRENTYLSGAILGMKRRDIERQFDEIVAFAEIEKFIDTPVKHYSSGMYLRLAFSVAAHLEPEILLVDEVLAVGDVAFQTKCLGKMEDVARQGRTILFVSHNMGAVRNLCSHGLLINEGRIKLAGAVDEVLEEYLGSANREGLSGKNIIDQQDKSDKINVRVVSFHARAIGRNEAAPQTGVGAEFIIEYGASDRAAIPRLHVGITVRDILGSNVFTCSTAMNKSDFYDSPSTGQVVCRIDSLPLIPGRYWVDIKLWDYHGPVNHITNAAGFDVIDVGVGGFRAYAKPSSGSILVPHKWLVGAMDAREAVNA